MSAAIVVWLLYNSADTLSANAFFFFVSTRDKNIDFSIEDQQGITRKTWPFHSLLLAFLQTKYVIKVVLIYVLTTRTIILWRIQPSREKQRGKFLAFCPCEYLTSTWFGWMKMFFLNLFTFVFFACLLHNKVKVPLFGLKLTSAYCIYFRVDKLVLFPFVVWQL